MAKGKRKLTPAQKREKARRQAEFKTIFVNGKQRRVRRPALVEGMPVDEFIRRNADPIWLHQNEMWEYMPSFATDGTPEPNEPVQPLEATNSTGARPNPGMQRTHYVRR